MTTLTATFTVHGADIDALHQAAAAVAQNLVPDRERWEVRIDIDARPLIMGHDSDVPRVWKGAVALMARWRRPDVTTVWRSP